MNMLTEQARQLACDLANENRLVGVPCYTVRDVSAEYPALLALAMRLQAMSDAVEEWGRDTVLHGATYRHVRQFILPKRAPDPLVDYFIAQHPAASYADACDWSDKLTAYLVSVGCAIITPVAPLRADADREANGARRDADPA